MWLEPKGSRAGSCCDTTVPPHVCCLALHVSHDQALLLQFAADRGPHATYGQFVAASNL